MKTNLFNALRGNALRGTVAESSTLSGSESTRAAKWRWAQALFAPMLSKLAMLAAAALLSVGVANAATYTVTSNANNTAENTLRWALAQAVASGDEVVVQSSVTSISFQGNTAIAIPNGVTLKGNGVTITSNTSGNGLNVRFTVAAGVAATIEGVRFNAVYCSDNAGNAVIANSGTLTLKSCIFSNNTRGSGAILNLASAVLNAYGCTFVGNTPGAITASGATSGFAINLVGNLFQGNSLAAAVVWGSGDAPDAAPTTHLNVSNSMTDEAYYGLTTSTYEGDDVLLDATLCSATGYIPTSDILVLPEGYGDTYTDYPTADFYGNTITAGRTVGAVAVTPQTITWEQSVFESEVPMGAEPITLSAEASGAGAIAYASSSAAVATVNSSTLTIVGAGTATITATQAGSTTGYASAVAAKELTVAKQAQTISWAAEALTGSVGQVLTLDAVAQDGQSSPNGLAVAYTSADPTKALVEGSTLILLAQTDGAINITASQAGSAAYNAALDVVKALTVNALVASGEKTTPTITWAQSLTGKHIGDIIELGATIGNDLALTYVSSDPAIAEVVVVMSEGEGEGEPAPTGAINLVLKALGEASVTAFYGGDGETYNPAAPVTQAVSVVIQTHTVTTGDDSGDDEAPTAGSLRAAVAAAHNGDIIEVSGDVETITLAGGLNTLLLSDITIKGNGVAITAADDFGHTIVIGGGGGLKNDGSDKKITIERVHFKNIGASQSDIINRISLTLKSCIFSGSTGALGAVLTQWNLGVEQGHRGNVYAYGCTFYNNSVGIYTHELAGATIKLVGNIFHNSPNNFAVSATKTTDYNVTNSTAESLAGGEHDVVSAGATLVDAATFAPIAAVPVLPELGTLPEGYPAVDFKNSTLVAGQTVGAVALTPQTITWEQELAEATVGVTNPITLSASASSSETVVFSSSAEEVATVDGTTLTIVGAGTSTITATVAGTATYTAASATKTLTVVKQSQTISWEQELTGTAGGTISLTATAGGGEVTYASNAPLVATISGSTLTLVSEGTANITASQAGNDGYLPATDVVRVATISAAVPDENKQSQTITWEQTLTGAVGSTIELTATAEGGAVTYASGDPLVATVSGSTLTLVSLGTATIRASQAGGEQYNPAPVVDKTLTVTPRTILVTSGEDDGEGSLRAALAAAEDLDIIEVQAELGTITLTNNLATTKNVTIKGNGVVLTTSGTFGVPDYKILIGEAGGLNRDVTIERVHFRDMTGATTGAILNRAPLTLKSCIFSGNSSANLIFNQWGQGVGFEQGYYGEIYAYGCTFVDNGPITLQTAQAHPAVKLVGNIFQNTAATSVSSAITKVFEYNVTTSAALTGTSNKQITGTLVGEDFIPTALGFVELPEEGRPEGYPTVDFNGAATTAGLTVGALAVARPLSSNADLATLAVSEGVMVPEFSADVLSYTVAVGNAVESLTITATKAYAASTVEGDGAKTINEGVNPFSIVVTAESGAVKTYSVTVNRPTAGASSVATLAELTVNGKSVPEFSADAEEYAVSVEGDVTTATIVAKPTNAGAIVTGAGAGPQLLAVGDNVFEIVVLAEDYVATKTYKVTITRAAPATPLTLTVTSGANAGVGTLRAAVAVAWDGDVIEVAPAVGAITLTGDLTTTKRITIKGNGVVITATGTYLSHVLLLGGGGGLGRDVTIERVHFKDMVAGTGAILSRVPLTLKACIFSSNVGGTTAVFSQNDPDAEQGYYGEVYAYGCTFVGLTDIYEQKGRSIWIQTVGKVELIGNIFQDSWLDLSLDDLTTDYNVTNDDYEYGDGYFLIGEHDVVPAEYVATLVNATFAPTAAGIPALPSPLYEVYPAYPTVDFNGAAIRSGKAAGAVTLPLANANLATLAVTSYELAPTFDKDELSYTLSVPNEVASITITATTEDAGAAVAGDGEKTGLAAGQSTPYEVTVTAEDGTVKTYTVTVTRAPANASDNAYLANLTVTGHTLTPSTFSKDVLAYTLSVPYSVDSVTIVATKDHEAATVSHVGANNATGVLKLIVGVNRDTIKVAAEDGAAKKAYVVTVTRAPYVPVTRSVTVGANAGAGSLRAAVEAAQNLDTIQVAANVGTITLTGILSVYRNITIKGNGVVLTNTGAGYHPFVVRKAVAADGEVGPSAVAVTIERVHFKNMVSNDAAIHNQQALTLKSCIFSGNEGKVPTSVIGAIYNNGAAGGTLSVYGSTFVDNIDYAINQISGGITAIGNVFQGSYVEFGEVAVTTDYNVTNDDYDRELMLLGAHDSLIAGTLVDATTFAPTAMGFAALPNPLPAGYPTVDFYGTTVAAGLTVGAVAIDPASILPSSNAYLATLTVSAGTLTPAFNKDSLTYRVEVAGSVESITIEATAEDSKATVEGVGTQTLAEGASFYGVEVTAEDGTTKTYEVTVVRLSNNTNLATLTVSEGTLSPAFNKDSLTYRVEVANSVTSLTITATVEDEKASVTGGGEKTGFVVGATPYPITVTAEDGTKKNYTVIVSRATPTAVAGATQLPLVVYPTLTDGLVYVENAEGAEVTVYALSGLVVVRTNAAAIDLSGQTAGVYIIRIGARTGKVVKK
jgi:hypothetical protein